jgi:hypothetical protein
LIPFRRFEEDEEPEEAEDGGLEEEVRLMADDGRRVLVGVLRGLITEDHS